MADQFKGKVALVTGAASGIGRASAIAFAGEGASVIVADITADKGQETVSIIKQAGGEASFVAADVTNAKAVEALVKRTIGIYGRLDYAHNNAGTEGAFDSIVDCTEENWDRVINTNLRGIWLCMKYEIPEMLKVGGGAIVNTGSVAGMLGFEKLGAYVASKHGIVGITKTASIEFARQGIRVNAVCPAVTRTPLIENFYRANPEMEQVYAGMHPIGRIGTPEEMAKATVWLCSDAASFVTGSPMLVDGGLVYAR